MLGGDGRFRMEPGEHVPGGRPLQPFHTEPDPFAIPKRSVLLLQEQQASHSIDARPQPGHMEMHEREQGEALRNPPTGCSARSVASLTASSQSSRRIACSACAERYPSLKRR